VNQVEYERSGEAPLWEISFDDANPECKHPLPGDWDFGVDPTGRKVYYVTGGLPGEKPLTIYSDVDGALSAPQG
jgi:hypothetical protein